MELLLKRKEFYPDRTIGGFYIDGLLFYYTLEDMDRKMEEDGIKVPKQTAIPRGRYQVVIDFSNRYQRMMPHLLNVPQFEGIRIHVGNYPGDTEGCILIGEFIDDPNHIVLESKKAFGDFFPRLEAALKEGKVWITIE